MSSYYSWFLDIEWYKQVYIICGILAALGFIVFLSLFSPYSRVRNAMEREYKRLASQHFFISFRQKKQKQLKTQVSYKVASHYDTRYIFYQIASVSLFIATFAFGTGIWFFAGSFIYEAFKSNDAEPAISENRSGNDNSDESYEDLPEGGSDPNTHHVDPHWVDGYERSDGTKVDGYWRGGEDGYERSDPDGDISNNLNSDDTDNYNTGTDSSSDSGSDGYDGLGEELGEFIFDN